MSFGILELGEVSELWNIGVKLGELLSVENLGFGDMNFEILELGNVNFEAFSSNSFWSLDTILDSRTVILRYLDTFLCSAYIF